MSLNRKKRKSVITEELIEEVKNLKEIKKLPITQIVKITGRSRSTIYKILKKELNYICQPAKLIKQNSLTKFIES